MTDNIGTAIIKVMENVGYVQKKSAAGLNYKYAGEAALIAALRPEMVANGIFVSMDEVKEIIRETYTTSKGSTMNDVIVSVLVRFTHAPSATSITVASTGEGSDVGDKATNKALTGAYKYALRQTFCIETGDDPDDFASDKMERERKVDSQPAAKNKLSNKNTPPVDMSASMTLETALNVTNSEGTKYGDLDSKTLSNMTIGIGKVIHDADDEKRAEYQMKLDAISVILTDRASLK